MISFDRMQALLGEIIDEVPEVFFRELNGGIRLIDEAIIAPEAVDGDVYIMGEYCEDDLGCCILIYYGSFCEAFFDADESAILAELRETLLHEFTHHIEALAGEYGLEEKDAAAIAAYLREQGKKAE